MKQYHRVVAEIDLDAIEHNYNELRSIIDSDCKVCAVIKADGYGHGAIPIAKVLHEIGVDYFAVAASQEAMALRRNGVIKPILVLGYTNPNNYKDMIEHNLVQTVFRLDMAKQLSDVAKELGKMAHIHIKIDTGMGRIGFSPCEATIEVIKKIASLPFIEIDGIFSHFARADEVDKRASDQQQIAFDQFLKDLKEEKMPYGLIHMSNSAGLIDIAKAHYDMVRVGIALYGLYPSEEVHKNQISLKPSLTLKSNVILVKEVGPGQPISYGGRYVTKSKSVIATIPVGYGDGYPRSLSNKGYVLIRGQKAPILGSVCMDQFMVDVTDIPNVVEGDEVVLIGSQVAKRISVEDIAQIMGTINYEVVCQLGKRIPRVYFREEKAILSIDYF